MDLDEVIRDTLEIEAAPHDIDFDENEQQQQQQNVVDGQQEQRLMQQAQQRQQEILLRQQQRPMRLLHEPSALRVNISTSLPKEITIWLYYFSRSPSGLVWKKIMTRSVLTMITANNRWWANPYLDSLINKGLQDIMNIFPFDLFKDFIAATPTNISVTYPTDSHEPFRYTHPIRNRGSKFPDIAVFANEHGQASTNVQIFVDLDIQSREPRFNDQERSMIEEIRRQLEAKLLPNASTLTVQTPTVTVIPPIPTPTPSTSSIGPPTSTSENPQRNIDLREQMQGTVDPNLDRDRRVNYRHHPYEHDDDRHLDRRGRGRGRSRGPVRRHYFDRDDYYY